MAKAELIASIEEQAKIAKASRDWMFFSLADSFGDVIKKAREGLSMTQRALAEKCGVGAIYISRIENDSQKIPSDRVCLKLAEVLGLDPRQLIQLGHRLKTPPEFRKFLNTDSDNNNPLTENVDDSIRKVLNDPSVKNLLIELSRADLPREVVSRLLKSWVEMFVETIKALKEAPKNEGVSSHNS